MSGSLAASDRVAATGKETMRDANRFADRHAPLFAVIVTIAFLILLFVVVAIGARLPGPYGLEGEGAIGRMAIASLGVAILSSFGWMSDAGLAAGGDARSWLLMLPVLIYAVIVYPLLFTGTIALNLRDPLLSALVAANGFSAGLMEEIVFRGLIFCALLKHWGRSRTGTARSLLLSAALFSLPHALNLFAGSDTLRVCAQLVWAFLLGIAFGSLVLAGGSLWPVAFLHGLSNAFVHVNRLGANAQTSPAAAILLALASVPPLAYALIVLARTRSARRTQL